MIAQAAALILALAKAAPALARLVDLVAELRANQRAQELHHAIDDAIAQARKEHHFCPRADCPFRVRDNAAVASGTPPQTP